MTLKLTINGVDFTDKWRPYESHWTMRAYMGESTPQTSLIIDDDDGTIDHADLASGKLVEITEDASGSEVYLYHGRVSNKTLGRGPLKTDLAMRWTVTCDDANLELRGIRVTDSHRPDESDRERVLAFMSAYLNGVASTNAHARDDTELDGGYVIAADLVDLPSEDYRDTYPDQVFTSICDISAKTFFVFVDDDGQLQLYYASHDDTSYASDITITDDGTADDIDSFAPYKSASSGEHDGQRVITGGGVRYGSDEFHEDSDIAGGEADHWKFEEHFTDEYLVNAGSAQSFLTNVVAARSNEDFTFPLSIDIDATRVHRLKAGMITTIRVASADQPVEFEQRATLVTVTPKWPDADGEAAYMVTAEFGLPRGRPFRRNIRRKPGPFSPTQPNADACTRYYLGDTSPGGVLAADATWETSSTGGGFSNANGLFTTPEGLSNGQLTWSAVGAPAGEYVTKQYQKVLNSTEAAILAAGGAEFHLQMKARSRYGAGISESAQLNYLTAGVRIYRPGTASFVGTALVPGAAVGSVKMLAQAVTVNRSLTATLAAVGGAVATDLIVVEIGTHHVGPTSGGTGSSIIQTDNQAGDLPEDDISTGTLNAWIDICTGGGGGSTTEPVGGGGEASPGTSNVYAPIDHVHEHGILDPDDIHMHAEYQVHQMVTNSGVDPTVTDDADSGFSRGWHWNNTTTGDVFFLRDSTEGAADWLLIAPETAGGGMTNPMTTRGDMIRGDAGGPGDPERFAIGTAGYHLVARTDPTWEAVRASLNFIVDGAGSVVTTGGPKGFVKIDFDCVIEAWDLEGDVSTSTVMDIKKRATGGGAASSITAAAKPTITTATEATSSTLTGWTTTVSAGDKLYFHVDSNNNATKLTLELKLRRT